MEMHEPELSPGIQSRELRTVSPLRLDSAALGDTPPVQCRRLPALRLERLGSCIWLWRAGDLEGLQGALLWLKMRLRIWAS